tara:strand:+ start:15378 stop:15674 length:297 start_codon:yes stop_codon:yes gene_type:complete
MYIEVTKNDFVDAFKRMGREDIDHNFSYYGLCKLFDYYEELESGTDNKIQLDVIAICCDWSEFDSEKEALENYGVDDISELESTMYELDNEHLLVMDY